MNPLLIKNFTMTYSKKKMLGDLGEFLAVQLLDTKGLSLVSQNHPTQFGEIDIVCQAQEYLYFVEVKLTTSSQRESVYKKWKSYQSQNLFKSAHVFLSNHYSEHSQKQVVFLFIHFDFSQKNVIKINLHQPSLKKSYRKKAI